MERNMILAVILSTLFILVWYRFFTPRPVVPPSTAPSVTAAPESNVPKPTAQKLLSKGFAEKETEEILETPYNQLTIVSHGAAVKHWLVKEWDGDQLKPDSEWVDLVNHPSPNHLLSSEQLPLSTFPELSFTLDPGVSSKSKSTWQALLPNGIMVKKVFEADSKFIRLTLSFQNPKNTVAELAPFELGWEQGLGTVQTEQKENLTLIRVLAYPAPSKEVVKFKKREEHKSNYEWFGVDNRYYLFAMLPLQGPLAGIIGEKTKHNPGELKGLTQSLSLAPGETRSFEFQLYGGSKGYTQLKKLGLNLEHAVDFGYFGFLGKWALKAMDTLHRITGNYGWAIVILTCFLQVLLLPLSIKSYTSMAAMKKLQPKIQELQKRYKGKPKELNQETMNLYKSSGTNPFGGCLPMILQIPVFWAFFTMLRNSFELRGAPWIFWIHDLSQKDPYYVLPILMGLGMLIQQKMSGQSGGVGGDPMQAKIMMFLPVIFTLMFLKFPSGLVLYWFTNSLLSMSIQWGCAKRYAKT